MIALGRSKLKRKHDSRDKFIVPVTGGPRERRGKRNRRNRRVSVAKEQRTQDGNRRVSVAKEQRTQDGVITVSHK